MPPATARPTATLATHAVANQPEVAGPLDPWADDAALREQAGLRGANAASLAALGRAMAEGDAWALGEEARRVSPELRAFDRGGRRLDEVRFSPAYHALMAMGLGAGYAALPWARRRGASPPSSGPSTGAGGGSTRCGSARPTTR